MITHTFIRSNLETIINLENTALKTVKIKIADMDTGDLKKQDFAFEIQRICSPDNVRNFELTHSVNSMPREKDGEFKTLSEVCEKLLSILKATNFIKWKSFSLEVS